MLDIPDMHKVHVCYLKVALTRTATSREETGRVVVATEGMITQTGKTAREAGIPTTREAGIPTTKEAVIPTTREAGILTTREEGTPTTRVAVAPTTSKKTTRLRPLLAGKVT